MISPKTLIPGDSAPDGKIFALGSNKVDCRWEWSFRVFDGGRSGGCSEIKSTILTNSLKNVAHTSPNQNRDESPDSASDSRADMRR